ncbi:hypothetical protein [Rheinheimera salexigens]|uniref:Uncharacterized protein n=1 Tax=Rheinheimera salexigens TaxID=1628148 RepID=A0A1E7Q852_9GAMM|nr:hypothetical protein [Rheinheimera salexigens]OEY70372.1 hypothetical protein BI198_12895 [Rheinheimera salexigens]
MAKLSKQKVAGIRLIADIFVIEDLIKEVISKSEGYSDKVEELREHLKKHVPEPFEAANELQRQIKEARSIWRSELEKGNVF